MTEQLSLAGVVKPVLIGIGGCSGSGKTTLAAELASELDAALFPLDFYYRDLAHLSLEERNRYNFDHPDSLEHSLIVEHVKALSQNIVVERPVYDFSTHSRVSDKTTRLSPKPCIIVEGILALHYCDLIPLYDLTVFVDAPHDVCLMRRIHRDVRERGRTEASVREQFEATARPMADGYVLPCRAHADPVVHGTEALDWSIESVRALLSARGLLPATHA